MECKEIRGGFSFCGVDIAELGLSYAPENENTYVYRPTEVNIHEETFDGHHGGYFYGATKQPKEFTLRCYFEDEVIDKGIMERIYNLFRTGKSGKLIFDRRPWCYYYATVTGLPHPELSNFMNGLITITMKAYYPFARGDALYYNPNTTNGESIVENDDVLESTALLEKEIMIPDTHLPNTLHPGVNNELIRETHILLYNPGTEYAPVSITAAGDAGLGVVIHNETTGQECRLVEMDKATTTDVSKAVVLDGINGKTSLLDLNSNMSTPAFYCHDAGYIELAPAYPATRNIFISAAEGDRCYVTNLLDSELDSYFIGKYIFITDRWYEIIDILNEHTLRLGDTLISAEPQKTMIVLMNKITIRPDDTMALTHLSFSYKPTYA